MLLGKAALGVWRLRGIFYAALHAPSLPATMILDRSGDTLIALTADRRSIAIVARPSTPLQEHGEQ